MLSEQLSRTMGSTVSGLERGTMAGHHATACMTSAPLSHGLQASTVPPVWLVEKPSTQCELVFHGRRGVNVAS